MFFLMPVTVTFAIYLGAAIIPAVYLLRYIYKMDAYEPEPASLLKHLLGLGVVSALLSIVLESIGVWVLDLTPFNSDTAAYVLILLFLIIAVIEEGTKYYLMYRRTWNDPNFNCRFDGIVYAAFTSVGFAAFENVKYIMSYGLSVALPRAFLAIPGHLAFSVAFGYFYGRAKMKANRGDQAGAQNTLKQGYLASVFLHGFYDACAMMQTGIASIGFILIVIVIYTLIFKLIKTEAKTDHRI